MKKRWVRVLISLFAGGALNESASLRTGDNNPGLMFIGAIVTYILLAIFVYFQNIYQLQRQVDRKNKFKKDNEDIIDNL